MLTFHRWSSYVATPLRFKGDSASRRSENHPPGEFPSMKPNGLRSLRDSEGKGLVGCLIFIVLTCVAIFMAIQLGPIYYANFNLEAEVKTEVSRAGARFLDDETVAKDIIDMAKRNDIRLDRKNIKVQRFAGQVHIEVNYSVPIDFIIMQRDLSFHIKESSFVGTL
jgi:hypothetical protein